MKWRGTISWLIPYRSTKMKNNSVTGIIKNTGVAQALTTNLWKQFKTILIKNLIVFKKCSNLYLVIRKGRTYNATLITFEKHPTIESIFGMLQAANLKLP